MPTAPLVHKKFVQIGRVAYIGSGDEQGKLCAIVDVIDQQRALIEGPCTRVPRQPYNFKHLQLTDFVIKFGHSAPTKVVKEAWQKGQVDKLWANTQWARNLAKKAKRATLTDFDRYKLTVAKFRRNRLIDREFRRLKKIKGVEKPGTKEHKRSELMLKKRIKNRGKTAGAKILLSIRLHGKDRKAARRAAYQAGVKTITKSKAAKAKSKVAKKKPAVAKKTESKKPDAKKVEGKKPAVKKVVGTKAAAKKPAPTEKGKKGSKTPAK